MMQLDARLAAIAAFVPAGMSFADIGGDHAYLAAALVLNADGKRKFQNEKKLTINKFFHDYLMNYFENVVIPKRWRYVASLPCDVHGKKHKEDIAALFATRDASDAAVR